MSPKELIERLLESKRRHCDEALMVAGLKKNEIDREAWIARAAEIQIFITDLEMLLPYLEEKKGG